MCLFYTSHKLLTAISEFHEVFAFENESWVVIFVARCQKGLTGIAISERAVCKSFLNIHSAYSKKKKFLKFHSSRLFESGLT